MKINARSSIFGGAIAFFLGTACCWLPVLLVSIGAGTGLMVLVEGVQEYSAYLMIGGATMLLLGGIQIYNKENKERSQEIITTSMITCPECGFQKEEMMPTNACQYFYECSNCKKVLKPNQGDCCVYCSYGSIACPPIQANKSCC